jgi:hypothetical protein
VSGAVTGNANFDGSGNINITTTATSDPTITLGGDLSGSATLTNLGNATLTATINANSVALGTDTTGSYVQQGATSGNGISGSVNSEAGTFTVTSNATNANTGNTIVYRDASGNFSAGTITANLTGTASNAGTLDSLDSSQFLRSDTSDTANASISFASGADLSGGLDSNLTGFFLPQNPEGKHLKSPFFFNDISYARLRGATVSVDVDGSPMTDTGNIDAMLNANGDFWNMSTSGVTTATITITDLPKGLTYGAYMGLTFGNPNWRANSITLEYSTNNGSTWTTARSTTSNSEEYFLDSFSTSGTATNALRWTLSNFASSSMRVVSLFAYNYNSSGMEGLYVTRDGGDVYGNLTLEGTLNGGTPWTTANDGSGSGLDADLLDGNHASAFARYSSSGTISNALASEAWVANYNTSTNVDHVWHDDGANAWNFNSDSAFKATANSRVNAGSFYAGGNVVWNAGNDGAGSGLDADTVDGLQASQFIRSDATDTATGVITFSDRIQAHEIRTNTNQELILNAGESASYATGQTGEYVYVNAESGLQINTSPDNWTSGWAGRDTFTFSSSGMQFPDGSTQTSAGASTGKAIAMAIVFG